MSLPRKIESWADKGLITADQAAAILGYEQGRGSNRWRSGVLLSGMFSILLGISLVIAANWHAIPVSLKLLVHIVLNACAAYAVWRLSVDQTKKLWAEGAMLLHMGLTLTLIALIGQIYQLQGSVEGALRLWLVLVTPTILVFGRAAYTARLWALAAVVISVGWLADALEYFDARTAQNIMLCFAILAPYVIVQALRRFTALGAPVAPLRCLQEAVAVLVVLGVSFGTAFWFWNNAHDGMNTQWLVGLVGGALPLCALYAWQRHKGSINGMDHVLLISGLFIAIGVAPLPASDVLSAIMFIVYWLFLGAVFQELGWASAVSASIFVITIRLYALFIQLFGGLLMKGYGLIAGGLVLLALVWVAQKANRHLRQKKQEAAT